ncbi:hypothetical protein P7K49_016471 [Saguinus oedipus]|uniref:Uncharacterized protein n=1 Tax=Saguinus oedipus TaxID=9490 RepID=A0ABQ9VF26_SAGOE|nr:hypothetical protein P7K49_016471 [Saguinus oedipus]
MEGERRASQARSSGLPAGGAEGESSGGGTPFPGSSGSSALLQAEVLDLDEDEDDLEVFSKSRETSNATLGVASRARLLEAAALSWGPVRSPGLLDPACQVWPHPGPPTPSSAL